MKIQVVVHSNAKHPRIEDRAGMLHIYVFQPPVEGKANEAVRVALAKHFGLNKSQIVPARGEKSKIKIFQIIDK